MQQTPDPEEIQLDLSAKGIWQKRSDESASSYAVFSLYLKLGDDATLKQVADKSGRTPAAVAMLSSRYHWQVRAQAWRTHLANLASPASNGKPSRIANCPLFETPLPESRPGGALKRLPKSLIAASIKCSPTLTQRLPITRSRPSCVAVTTRPSKPQLPFPEKTRAPPLTTTPRLKPSLTKSWAKNPNRPSATLLQNHQRSSPITLNPPVYRPPRLNYQLMKIPNDCHPTLESTTPAC